MVLCSFPLSALGPNQLKTCAVSAHAVTIFVSLYAFFPAVFRRVWSLGVIHSLWLLQSLCLLFLSFFKPQREESFRDIPFETKCFKSLTLSTFSGVHLSIHSHSYKKKKLLKPQHSKTLIYDCSRKVIMSHFVAMFLYQNSSIYHT